MTNEIKSIAIDKLVPHPNNPNRMSKANFRKLVRNIEQTGRYEPLIVRPQAFSCGRHDHCQSVAGTATDNQVRSSVYQIINGHHRWQALKELGYKTADAVVWDIDDEQTDMLLATLNRLGGSDVLEKKLELLRRLNTSLETKKLAKLIPQSKKHIERLLNMKLPIKPSEAKAFARPIVFFLNNEQSAVVEDALFLACLAVAGTATDPTVNCGAKGLTKAAKKAEGLAEIARFFLSFSKSTAK